MAIEKVNGIAVVSGKGGVGKSVIALNLALAIGQSGIKTLLFDACGGDLANLTNAGKNNPSYKTGLIQVSENVNLYSSNVRNPYAVSDSKDIHKFLQEIIKATPGHSFAVFDCPTGVSAISQILAGLSERVLLISTADPTSIAGSYILAKTLHHEGMAARCGVVFNQVESSDEAISLKTRFDIISRQFLSHRFSDFGFIRKDQVLARSVVEQTPLLNSSQVSPASQDFVELAERISPVGMFHNATALLKTHSVIGG